MDNDQSANSSNILIEEDDKIKFNENTFIGVKDTDNLEKQNKIGNIRILLNCNKNPIISIGPDCKYIYLYY